MRHSCCDSDLVHEIRSTVISGPSPGSRQTPKAMGYHLFNIANTSIRDHETTLWRSGGVTAPKRCQEWFNMEPPSYESFRLFTCSTQTQRALSWRTKTTAQKCNWNRAWLTWLCRAWLASMRGRKRPKLVPLAAGDINRLLDHRRNNVVTHPRDDLRATSPGSSLWLGRIVSEAHWSNSATSMKFAQMDHHAA